MIFLFLRSREIPVALSGRSPPHDDSLELKSLCLYTAGQRSREYNRRVRSVCHTARA